MDSCGDADGAAKSGQLIGCLEDGSPALALYREALTEREAILDSNKKLQAPRRVPRFCSDDLKKCSCGQVKTGAGNDTIASFVGAEASGDRVWCCQTPGVAVP